MRKHLFFAGFSAPGSGLGFEDMCLKEPIIGRGIRAGL